MKITKNLSQDDKRLFFEMSHWDDVPMNRKFSVGITRNDGKADPIFERFNETEVTTRDISKFLPNLKSLTWEREQKIDTQISTAKDEAYTVMLYFPIKEQWWQPEAVEKLFIAAVSD